MALNDRETALVKGMIVRGDRQHDIASYFGVNAARIAEIKKGALGSSVTVAAAQDLPPPGPYMAGRSAIRARETLIALRELIDEAITEIGVFEKTVEPSGGE